MSTTQYAPIAIFCYNRLEHLQKTVESLLKNAESSSSIVYFFCDGAKSDNSAEVDRVRSYVRSVEGFKVKNIIERNFNLGLARSIISGVTKVTREFGKVIVVEDDLEVSPYFLKYMNDGLKFYENEEKVVSIVGYTFPMKADLPETFLLGGADCWGWGTWKRGWDLFEPDGRKLLDLLEAKKLLNYFDVDGSFPFTQMLRDQIAGRNNSWAIRWQASAVVNGRLSVYPARSLVQNIGFDNSGTHCGPAPEFKVEVLDRPIRFEKIRVEENLQALNSLAEFNRSLKSRSVPSERGRFLPKKQDLRDLNRALKENGFKGLLVWGIKRFLSPEIIRIVKQLQKIDWSLKANPSSQARAKREEELIGPHDQYPRIFGDELTAVKDVLESGKWNLHMGTQLAHHQLEDAFAKYIGVNHAVAVNTGGVALQIALRALGVKPGKEIIHQVDTCVANAFAAINAGGTPIFADVDRSTGMLLESHLRQLIGPNTQVLNPIHMWGNVENMDMILKIADENKLSVIEDGCLALGAKLNGKMVGSMGHCGVFSFGTLKPMQAGEGGMIVTNDDALAKELRTLRIWGDRTVEYGVRDQFLPAWNGRMSEVVAAVLKEQLKGYPSFLKTIQDCSWIFIERVKEIDGIEVILPGKTPESSAFTQVVIKIDEKKLGISKTDFMEKLKNQDVIVWHSSFEPINSLSFFKNDTWSEWIVKGDLAKAKSNYEFTFPNANKFYNEDGIGFFRNNFFSIEKTRRTISAVENILKA